MLAVVLAGFASDGIAHLAVHRQFPHGRDFRTLVRISTNALGTLTIPLGLIVAAWIGILELDTALLIAGFVYIGVLGLVGWLAVTRIDLEPGNVPVDEDEIEHWLTGLEFTTESEGFDD